MKEKAREITVEEKAMLLGLEEDDLTLNKLKTFFAYTKNKEPQFQPFDTFTLEVGEYHNKETIKTSVGRYVYNKIGLGDKLCSIIGYQNLTMGKGGIGDVDDELSKLLLTNKITIEDMTDYLDRCQNLGFGIAKFMNASLTDELLIPPEVVEKRKAELVNEYSKDIASGNVLAADKIEKELLNLAKGEVKDIPSQQIYDSGCRGSYGNNYKNSTIMRGAIKNLADPEKITISTKSLVDGIPPEEFAAYADLITQASYNRAVDMAA